MRTKQNENFNANFWKIVETQINIRHVLSKVIYDFFIKSIFIMSRRKFFFYGFSFTFALNS